MVRIQPPPDGLHELSYTEHGNKTSRNLNQPIGYRRPKPAYALQSQSI
jgi:hypothetical protein